jgi:hypothetical protein
MRANPVNVIIKKEGKKYNLYTKDGKRLLGSHSSRHEAKQQEIAIDISKARAAGHNIPKK